MTIGFAAVPFAFMVVEVPLAVGTLAFWRLTAPPPGLVTLTPGSSVTVNNGGGGVWGPVKLMLVLKVPVHVVLGWAAVRGEPLAIGEHVCATAGSDKPRDIGASAVAAISQIFRCFAPTLTRRCRRFAIGLPP
jgi:hypothetical protein